MGQMAPPPPESWAAERAKNREGRAAEPVVILDEPNEQLPLQAYKVVGPKEVFDTAPGGIVELALTEGQELALIEAGHLALVADRDVPAIAVSLDKADDVAAEDDRADEPVAKED